MTAHFGKFVAYLPRLLVTNSANANQLIRYTGLGADAFEPRWQSELAI